MSRNAKPDSFVVTTEDGTYDIVEANVLERYAINDKVYESGSKQLKTDGWEFNDALLELLIIYQLFETLESAIS